jgi:virulence factor Mce-like protein
MARNRNVRVELTRSDLAKRGLVTIMATGLILAVIFGRSTGVLGGPDQISAQLVNAGGSLASGADVKMRGIIVGRVDGISAGPDGGVRVKMNLSGGQLDHIPANTVARILPATVFGTSYVDLTTHGKPTTTSLRPGAVVPADKSQDTLELQKALDDIDTLVKVLKPAQLNATLGAAASALDGRGAEIGSMIDNLDLFLQRLEPKVPLVRSDLTRLAANLELVEHAAPDLLDGVRDSLGTLHTIAAQKAALTTLLTGGRSIVDESNTFLAKVKPDLVSFLQNAAVVVDVYYDLRHQAFTDAFATLRDVQAKLATIIHHGWADNTVVIQATAPPYYTSADCPRFGSARGDNCAGLGRAGVRAMLDPVENTTSGGGAQ